MFSRNFLSLFFTFSFLLCPLSYEYGSEPVRSFESLLGLIRRENVKNVDELLPKLGLLSNYSFVFKSRSKMGATTLEPRVDLFSNDASFILAYAGS